jgi:aminoglycoside 6'-N-acetyltransferase I
VIEACTAVDAAGWLELRTALWPHGTREQHLAEMAAFIAAPRRYGQFIAYSPRGEAIGLAEVALRTDYVNGTETSPVAFLEGLYVLPGARRKGVAASLVIEVSRWARAKGCTELASDALLDNGASHATHRALGFAETERVVFFRKRV